MNMPVAEIVECTPVQAITHIAALTDTFRNRILKLLQAVDQPPSQEEVKQQLAYLGQLEEMFRDKALALIEQGCAKDDKAALYCVHGSTGSPRTGEVELESRP